LALHVLHGPTAKPAEVKNHDWRKAINQSRSALREYPRDAMRWADIGLAHTVLGNAEQAVRCLRIAVDLAPNNRFVLRAAARCFLHWGDPERAHAVLRSTPFVLHDPWLLAAEIATASSRGRRSRLYKEAKDLLLMRSIPDRDLSELATALGKLELQHGADKKASQLFTRALIEPTENVVAQIKWDVNERQNLTISGGIENINAPFLFEAKAADRYAAGDWSGAIENSDLWLRDQPFSSRPASTASHAAHLVGDYERAVDYLSNAKTSNPNDVMLLNNLAYYQVLAGRMADAEATFKILAELEAVGSERLIIRATSGLLYFRNRRPDVGRVLYEHTIAEADAERRYDIKAVALANLAREEFFDGKRDEAARLLTKAHEAIRRCPKKTVLNAEVATVERSIAASTGRPA
jgi:tetratricopeptide (TPR) repeat protein